jgi:hypothetical protein
MVRSYNAGPTYCVWWCVGTADGDEASPTARRRASSLLLSCPIPRTVHHASPYDCRRHSPSSTLRDGIPRDNSGSGRLFFSAPIARDLTSIISQERGDDREARSCGENPDGISAMGRIRSLEMIHTVPPDITSPRGRGISLELAGSGR